MLHRIAFKLARFLSSAPTPVNLKSGRIKDRVDMAASLTDINILSILCIEFNLVISSRFSLICVRFTCFWNLGNIYRLWEFLKKYSTIPNGIWATRFREWAKHPTHRHWLSQIPALILSALSLTSTATFIFKVKFQNNHFKKFI